MTLLQQVRRTVTEHDLFPRGEHVLVAVSGGADSVALLHALTRLATASELRLTVCHLDHRTRGAESRADAGFVRTLAASLDVPCVCGRSDVPRLARRRGVSLEMAAREARYAFFARTAKRLGTGTVATGHTSDDQAETVLLRLTRGSGHRGLGGIAPLANRGGLCIARPLLAVSRKQIETYLRRKGITWREDRTNTDMAFLRNRVRHEVLPLLEARLNPRVRDSLCRMAEIVREDEAWMDGLAGDILSGLRGEGGALDLPLLRGLGPAARRRVLVRWLHEGGVDPSGVSFDAVRRLDELLQKTHGTASVDVPGGWTACRRYDTLSLRRSERESGVAAPFREIVVVPGETIVAVAGLRVLTERKPGIYKAPRSRAGSLPAAASLGAARFGRRRLIVRSRQHGDRMRPFGIKGSRKLQDIFVDAKVPREARERIPVFECGGEIVWIPGYRVARGWEVPDPDAPAVQIRLERI